jgi:hypothetical protein
MILLFAGNRVGERVSGRMPHSPASYRAASSGALVEALRRLPNYDVSTRPGVLTIARCLVPCPPDGACDSREWSPDPAGQRVIAKPFILAKDNYRIGAKIIRDNKIIRDHGALLAAFAKRWRPMVPKRRGLRICRLRAAVWGFDSPDGPARLRPGNAESMLIAGFGSPCASLAPWRPILLTGCARSAWRCPR